MADLLRVAVEPASGRSASVVRVAGQVDDYTAPLLAACLLPRIQRGPELELVVNLEEVTFLGAAGLSILLRARERCESLGVRLVVHCSPGAAAFPPLQLAGLSRLVQAPGRRRPALRAHHRVPSARRAPERSFERTVGAS